MTVRQTAEENVEAYSRCFKNLLRKVNTNNLVPATLQVRMYLYGLNPLLTSLVSVNNPATLDAAIDRAKVVETGYNYIPTKPITLQVPANAQYNPISTVETSTATKETSIEELTKQMQQLSLNYANLSSALMAKTISHPRKEKKDVICYKCGKPGHISRECRSKVKSKPQTGNSYKTQTYKNINYLENDEFEDENEYTEEEESEEEIEVMLHTCAQTYTSESKKEQRLRKRSCHDNDIITDKKLLLLLFLLLLPTILRKGNPEEK